MADYKVTDTELTAIANAIRAKAGVSIQYEFHTGFVEAINALNVGDQTKQYAVGSEQVFYDKLRIETEGHEYVN